MSVKAIILSAGKGTRMTSDIPKQYIEIMGHPLLYYSIKAFEESNADEILIVADEEHLDYVRQSIVDGGHFSKVTNVIAGGKERYDSVRLGIEALSVGYADNSDGLNDILLIHDGARPFIRPEAINDVIAAAEADGAAIAAMPAKNTIKISDSQGFILSTTERENTWQAQTPQAFNFSRIKTAYHTLDLNNSFTDDAMVYQTMFPAKDVRLVKTGYDNIKITTDEDLEYAMFKLGKN